MLRSARDDQEILVATCGGRGVTGCSVTKQEKARLRLRRL
jgi:hypothetical protein